MSEACAALFKRFDDLLRAEEGATAIEYGLIATLISIAIIAGATIAGSQVAAAFNTVATSVQGALN